MLSKRLLLSLVGLLLLSGCSNTMQEKARPQTLLVQLILESASLTRVREKIATIINRIVREELGLNKDDTFDFFSAKKIHRLTLYYINDTEQSNNGIIFSALDSIKKSVWQTTNNISLTKEVKFFHGPVRDDELVIMINDPKKELSALNAKIKEVMHDASKNYKEKEKHGLYDIAKSERFDYVPHMGIGRIRSGSILERVKDPSAAETIFKKIQQRIVEAVNDVIKSDSSWNPKLSVEKIAVVDLHKQQYIKTIL